MADETLLSAIDSHLNLKSGHGTFREAGNTCTKCTLEHGTFIRPDFSVGSRTNENFTDLVNPICSAGNQCVGRPDEKVGCCQQCKDSQLCIHATIAVGGEKEAADWNRCPPGFLCKSFASRTQDVIKKCEAGTLCQDNIQMSCTDIRQTTIDAGLGDIHAGSYCPENEFRLLHCPQGYYCNSTDMSTKSLCPAGMFCPLKTETPQIKCRGCAEGAVKLRTDPMTASLIVCFTVLFLTIWAIVGWYHPKFLKNREPKHPKHIAAIKDGIQARRISAAYHDKPQYGDGKRGSLDEVRIFSMMTSIQRRVAKISDPNPRADRSISEYSEINSGRNSDKSVAQSSVIGNIINSVIGKIFVFQERDSVTENRVVFGNFPPVQSSSHHSSFCNSSLISRASIDFDAELVFDKLDTNHDNVLSYDELNVILKLNEVKLKYFVRKMNKLDGASLDITTISRECFVNHFYETLLNTESFDPDNDEAADIFEAIDSDSDGVIEGMDLHSDLLETFLTDRQIHLMMKKMGKKNDHGHLSIDKETFIEMYPTLLSDVILDSPFDPDNNQVGVDITFSDLSLTVQVSGESLNVVDSIGGRIHTKSLTAIMGGSGTGKTSLLNALSGKAHYGKVTGNILINGKKAHIDEYKHLMGFVPQDDIIYSELTVRENLIFAGRFKLPASTLLEEIKELADDVIVSLGLIRVRDRIVGDVRNRGISGGEKKRVSIGVELMGRPRVLFLDEPTSGLDASSSSLVMASLKSLAKDDGVTVVSVIHQPRKFIFELFSNVILLGFGGRVIYHGEPDVALSYFLELGYSLPQGENIADWLLDISSGQLGFPSFDNDDRTISGLPTGENLKAVREFLFDKWEEYVLTLPEEDMERCLLPPHPSDIPPKFERPSFFVQLRTQVKRNLLVMYRNAGSKLIDCLIIIFAVVLIAAIDGKSELILERSLRFDFGVALSRVSSASNVPLESLFFPFIKAAHLVTVNDAVKMSVVCAVLVGLNSTKVMSERKLEFFRESSSGYSINAYFLAVNITSTIEHSLQMALAGLVCILFRSIISSWISFILNFVLLGWSCVAWGLLFAVIMPPRNLIISLGFFMSFSSLIISGGAPPISFEVMYKSDLLQILSGFLSPSRFFIETFTVSEYKCLPVQTGFTTADGFSFTSIDHALNDKNVGVQSCGGWHYYFPTTFVVGLTIRFFAGILLHFMNRSELGQPSLRKSLGRKVFLYQGLLSVIILLSLLLLSLYLILR